jgi:phosphatidylglycerophosphate synthase
MVAPMGKETDGAVSRYLNRRLSFLLTRVLLFGIPNISPNVVSFVSFVIGGLGAIFFSLKWGILAGLAVQLSSILDGCDGEIARLQAKSSRFGAFFDSILDRYADSFIMMGLVVYCLRTLPTRQIFNLFLINDALILFIGFLALAGSFQVSYSAAKGQAEFSRDFSRTLQGRDTRLFIIFLVGLFSHLDHCSADKCLGNLEDGSCIPLEGDFRKK